MKSLLCAMLLFFVAVPTYAGDNKDKGHENNHHNSNADAKADSHSSAKATNGDVNGSVSAPVSVSTSTSTSDRRQANAPALGGLASGSCAGPSGGITIGLPFFGGGLQGATVDSQCTLRENIVVVSQFDIELAAEMVNGLDGVKEARARRDTRAYGEVGSLLPHAAFVARATSRDAR